MSHPRYHFIYMPTYTYFHISRIWLYILFCSLLNYFSPLPFAFSTCITLAFSLSNNYSQVWSMICSGMELGGGRILAGVLLRYIVSPYTMCSFLWVGDTSLSRGADHPGRRSMWYLSCSGIWLAIWRWLMPAPLTDVSSSKAYGYFFFPFWIYLQTVSLI